MEQDIRNSSTLEGLKVLLLEDEFIIGMDIEETFVNLGADVTGPLETVESALSAIKGGDFDVGILDLGLLDGEAFPAADLLAKQDTPFCFYTGHGRPDDLRERYPSAKICVKPTDMEVLVSAVSDLTTA